MCALTQRERDRLTANEHPGEASQGVGRGRVCFCEIEQASKLHGYERDVAALMFHALSGLEQGCRVERAVKEQGFDAGDLAAHEHLQT